MSKFLCIDPGLSGTGVALFSGDKKLICWKNIYGKGKDFEEKANYIVADVRAYHAHTAFCEFPTGNFSGNKGLAARNTDAILKLCFLIGKLSEHFDTFTLVPVQTWKGQLPKEVTQKRAEEYFHQKGFISHAADAVGIGKYVLQNNLV